VGQGNPPLFLHPKEEEKKMIYKAARNPTNYEKKGSACISTLEKLLRNITKFNTQATSSSIDMTIADEPASTSSDLSEDNFDATSKPAYFRSCILIGFFGGLGRDSPQISSTRFKSCKYTSS
jgi:hypothetical protein